MAICKYCSESINTHQRLSHTCYDCGRPYNDDITIIGDANTMLKNVNIGLKEYFFGTMSCYGRQVIIDNEPFYVGKKKVFIDRNDLLYTIDWL